MAVRVRQAVFLTVALLLATSGARAQDDEAAKLREQLRATVLQLRELQDQQSAAKAQAAAPVAQATSSDAATKAKLAAAQAQLRTARKAAADSAGLRADLDKAKADRDAAAAQAAAQAQELAKFKDAYAKAADDARAAAAERDRLKADLASQTNLAAVCRAKNARLVAFAENLIEVNRKISLGEKFAAQEPLLGYGRVKLENEAQDREDAVRAARCDPVRDAQPPPAGPPNTKPGS